jgi:hypothetical protein
MFAVWALCDRIIGRASAGLEREEVITNAMTASRLRSAASLICYAVMARYSGGGSDKRCARRTKAQSF